MLFLISLIFLNMSSSTTHDSKSYSNALENGVQLFYSGNLDEAQTQFDELLKSNPAQPEAWFFRTMIPFWKYFFGGESKDDAKEFLYWSDKAIRITDAYLRKNAQDTSSVLFLSGLHGYRALVAADQGQYSIAIKSGMTGFNFTKKILSMGEDQIDAKIGRGIYYYMTGSVPSHVKWMTSALGFDGDKEWGFRELEEAAISNSRVQSDANMILSYLYLKENKPGLALITSNRLIAQYPENAIYHYYKAKSLEALEKQDEAINAYKTVFELSSPFTHIQEEAKSKVKSLETSFTETLDTK